VYQKAKQDSFFSYVFPSLAAPHQMWNQ